MREHFWDRIYGEFQSYKASVLESTNAEIFALCYEIDTIITIYEILSDLTETFTEEELSGLLKRKNILRELYQLWLKKEDSHYSELKEHVSGEIKNIIA